MNTVDVGAILDEGQWSRYQKFLVFVTALAIVLDGLDNQVLGSAIPALSVSGACRGRPSFQHRRAAWSA
jgi:hypothetical protein